MLPKITDNIIKFTENVVILLMQANFLSYYFIYCSNKYQDCNKTEAHPLKYTLWNGFTICTESILVK